MSLGSMRDSGEGLTLYCAAHLGTRWCNTGWTPSWDQMIQYFGLDFEISADRARFLAMFECPNCGAPAHTLTLHSPEGYMRGMRSYDYGPDDPAEAARRRAEMEHDHAIYDARQAGYEQMHREAEEAAKAKRKAQRDREAGRDPIGPPNPWAHRKRGRWL